MPPRKKKASPPVEEQAASLEVAMEELSEIVGELESGQQPLSDALDKFERGMRLLKECDRQLNDAAGRIEIVRRLSDDGVEVEPFDGTATADRKQAEASDEASGKLFP
jgi:exodeoxyribonuclease VII small subunit